ncbi:hypothetical protein GQ53DRAFT_186166 [Thozetella sp. PMI_491]|nr:hypothetical protein GQ53DRAFT_186166 [Thozetella sp. PMI_491]
MSHKVPSSNEIEKREEMLNNNETLFEDIEAQMSLIQQAWNIFLSDRRFHVVTGQQETIELTAALHIVQDMVANLQIKMALIGTAGASSDTIADPAILQMEDLRDYFSLSGDDAGSDSGYEKDASAPRLDQPTELQESIALSESDIWYDDTDDTYEAEDDEDDEGDDEREDEGDDEGDPVEYTDSDEYEDDIGDSHEDDAESDDVWDGNGDDENDACEEGGNNSGTVTRKRGREGGQGLGLKRPRIV